MHSYLHTIKLAKALFPFHLMCASTEDDLSYNVAIYTDAAWKLTDHSPGC